MPYDQIAADSHGRQICPSEEFVRCLSPTFSWMIWGLLSCDFVLQQGKSKMILKTGHWTLLPHCEASAVSQNHKWGDAARVDPLTHPAKYWMELQGRWTHLWCSYSKFLHQLVSHCINWAFQWLAHFALRWSSVRPSSSSALGFFPRGGIFRCFLDRVPSEFRVHDTFRMFQPPLLNIWWFPRNDGCKPMEFRYAHINHMIADRMSIHLLKQPLWSDNQCGTAETGKQHDSTRFSTESCMSMEK